MPLKLGTTTIGSIYKGTTEIGKIYKGTTLIFESAVWLSCYYQYLYNSLIPTTISGKDVKNKARVNTIYGNSVVENQLVNSSDTSITLGTHKYLTYINGTWSLITGTSQTLSVNGGTDMVFDLTQMFPFDTPTTLNDVRVQALINRGYIAYNKGSIKSVSMSELSTKKADTTALQTITFKYQGNGVGTSHDTLEITNNGYVFTKDRALVDLSTLNFTLSGGRYYTSDLSSKMYRYTSSETQNSLATNYKSVVYNQSANTSESISENSGYLWVNSANAPTGKLEYQLATPQVITIPKKHLGIVDLGSLNYNKESVGNTYDFYSLGLMSLIKPATANNQKGNIVCFKWLTIDRTSLITGNNNKVVSVDTNGFLNIIDSEYNSMNATEFKTAMSGILLFYETNTEVADITTQIDIESGGTIISNSDVLPDARFDIKCK